MKRFLLAAASSLALAGAAAASPASFDLRLDQKNGERTIAVANGETGAFAVAAGGEELDLLQGGDAKAAFERLKMQPDIDIRLNDADREHDEHGKRKIVIHKMDYDEDQSDDEEKREVRVIKRHIRKSDREDGIEVEQRADAEDEIDIELADGDGGGEARRIVLINAADAKAAAKFIDGIKGLDNAEKAAMKSAVGL